MIITALSLTFPLNSFFNKSVASERQTIEATAESIENALFQKFGSAGKDYKDHYRSIYFNLKDSRNAVFFKRVMSVRTSSH